MGREGKWVVGLGGRNKKRYREKKEKIAVQQELVGRARVDPGG